MDNEIHAGSGNVFADLGLPEPDERAYKADLVVILEGMIERRGLTQVAAATLCGTDQGTLSNVLRGRIGRVSTDRLIRWLGRLGGRVEITVGETSGAAATPVSVRYCQT